MDLIEEIKNKGYSIEDALVFRSEEHKFYIIASIIQMEENESDIFETKF